MNARFLSLIDRFGQTVTVNSAKTFGISDTYGLEPGCRADFIILDARSVLDALRLSPARLFVVKSGCVMAQTDPARSRIHYVSKTKGVDYRRS